MHSACLAVIAEVVPRAQQKHVSQVRQLVKSVLPFHAMGFKNHRAVPVGATPGLKVLEGCACVLLQTISLEGYASGLEVRMEVCHPSYFMPAAVGVLVCFL